VVPVTVVAAAVTATVASAIAKIVVAAANLKSLGRGAPTTTAKENGSSLKIEPHPPGPTITK